jgi:23S rRNA (uracil1939-C5)-methyltransferase
VAVLPVVPAPDAWGYRSAVQPVAQRGALGYRRPESHEVVFLEDDPVALAGIRRLWRAWPDLAAPKGVREVVLRGNRQGEVLAALVATASERSLLDFAHALVRWGVAGVTYAPHDPRGRFRSGSRKLTGARSILEDYGDFRVQVTAHSFAQPNPAAASRLYLKLRELAPGGRRALDLYAGSGVIGMHLLAKYEDVIALEVDRGSVLRGEQDAARLGLGGLRFLRGDAKRLALPDADLIALDPPRAGLSRPLRDALDASAAGTLLYVSCDPVTWARDAADFLERGWRLTHAEPFDFYPQTHHVEMLSKLER